MREAPDAGAAPVAAVLLEFLKEPAVLRPAFIHGQRPLPQGDHVFRFAQGRFPHRLMRELAAPQRESVREAANAFIRQVCLRDEATHYQVLCLPENARAEAVKENYHLLMALIHPDRQDSARWPRGAAQRVNGSYEVLSDDKRRREYDRGMQHTATPRPFASQWEPRIAERSGRRAAGVTAFLKPIAAVGAVMVSLVFLQAWWMGDMPREYAILEHAMPLNMSSQWIRDVLPESAKPRFLEVRTVPTSATPDDVDLKETDRLPMLAPLWRALGRSDERESRRPKGAVIAKAEASVGIGLAASSARAVEPAAPSTERPVARDDTDAGKPESPREAPAKAAPPVAEKAVVVAQAVLAPPATSAVPATAAPLATAAPSATPARGPGSEDIEKLVIRLIGAYEAGDPDRLMGLVDTGEMGFWESLRVRGVFTDFFRATRQRRLELDHLAWQDAGGRSRAQGEATIVTEYFSDAGPTSRKVPVEMDIAVRDGKARITRLLLFPNVK